ncbi:CAP domain [Pseudocohnilembus persalinus]|uniref:CAP domain n=1 Tax=Pseudocohnilembus persalinus TaxID=266149 RepID=A0A0V0QWA7_PSEPJ|nr:CAP domain [Pseudocohnilembus persalinus]|eukprot:KRX06514.1 CAP domain [Pseudocohnilembus persalinus]
MSEKEKRVYYMKQAQQIRQQQSLTNEQMQFYQKQSQEFEKFGLKMAKKPKERIITMEKIEFDRIQEDQKALELLAWELSNKFRQENGLNPVKWSEGISQVCFKHSVNMGNKIVPFGHDGFNDRFIELQKISIVKSACENVAYSNQYINLAESIVKGWINSPGHRKNLLSHSNYMGIGVYRNSSGYWYFTQIFALMI